MTRALRTIKKVEYTPYFHVAQRLRVAHQWFCTLPDHYIPWRELCMSGYAAMETTDSVEDGIRTITTRVTVLLAGDMQRMPDYPVVWRLTDLSGAEWLIGTGERPHPLVTRRETRPQHISERNSVTLSIDWVGPLAPLKLTTTDTDTP